MFNYSVVLPTTSNHSSEVSVDIVGKYSYLMTSANSSVKSEIPVVVDVALVGRTKVLRIHR